MEDENQLTFKLLLQEHKADVRQLLGKIINDLHERAEHHDDSKMESPEVEVFAAHFKELGETQYGSPEYLALLEKVKPAIQHHYSKNRHHPEFWKKGIKDMDLVDILELLVDWKSATKLNKSGNINHSLEINKKKYRMCAQLVNILNNTIERYLT